MRSQENKQSKLRQYIGAPKKFLRKARDFYVESMVNIDGRVGYSAPPMALLPTNFVLRPQKMAGEIEDFQKVGQSVSMRNIGSKKVGLDKSVGVRSYSVMGLGRIGTIEEDKSYEFDEEVSSVNNDFLFPRSRSYAIPKRNSGFH